MRPLKYKIYDPNEDCFYNDVGIETIHLYDFDGDNITEQEGLKKLQYTGRNDINEIEIYEKDILLIKIHRWDKPEEVIVSDKAVVEFRDGCFGFEWGHNKEFKTFRDFTYTTFEVIGNMFENAEILMEG